MDLVFINDLRVNTVIGIYAWEQRITQTLSFDIELAADNHRAASGDTIADTVNYKAVAKRVAAFAQDSRYQLVETLAERVAELILSEFKIPWLRLKLSKPGAVRGARDVGVIIERGVRTA